MLRRRRLGAVGDDDPHGGGAEDDRVNELLGPLLVAGPQAQRECKALIRAVAGRPIDAKVVADTVRRIAAVRSTAEAKEGMAAFLGKRAAAWVPPELAERK